MHRLKWMALVGVLVVATLGCGGGQNVPPPSAADAANTKPAENAPAETPASNAVKLD